MTKEEIQKLDHYQIHDILKERGISGTMRPAENPSTVHVYENGEWRQATEEETNLHEQSVHSYHQEEAEAGLL